MKKYSMQKAIFAFFACALAGALSAPFAAGQAQPPDGLAAGEIFYEIRHETGEGAPSFLVGSQHNICLKRESLPPEINAVLDKADAAAMEAALEERSFDKISQALRASKLASEEESLDLHIEESKARKMFDIIKAALANDESGRLLEIFQKYFGVSFESFSDALRLSPSGALGALGAAAGFSNAPDKEAYFASFESGVKERLSAAEGLAQKDYCSSLEKEGDLMDIYLEKRVSCRKKPVYSLETAQSALSSLLQTPEAQIMISRQLSDLIDRLSSSGSGSEEPEESARAALYRQWKLKVNFAAGALEAASFENLYRSKSAEEAITKARDSLFAFFRANEARAAPLCEPAAAKAVEALIQSMLEYARQSHIAIAGGGDIEADREHILRLYDEARASHKAAFQSCFPFELPPRILKEESRIRATAWNRVKLSKAAVFDSRDSKLAAALADILNKERTVAAVVGAGHLSGILKELRAHGYEARPIALSHGIIEAEGACQAFKSEDSLSGGSAGSSAGG